MTNREIQYGSVEQVAENPKYPFTESQIRYHLLHRNKNGLATAVRKIGKRLYLRLDLFEAWIESQGNGR